jgi:hypothetical protein
MTPADRWKTWADVEEKERRLFLEKDERRREKGIMKQVYLMV